MGGHKGGDMGPHLPPGKRRLPGSKRHILGSMRHLPGGYVRPKNHTQWPQSADVPFHIPFSTAIAFIRGPWSQNVITVETVETQT